MIRQLQKDEKIPFDLLLLADETIEAINKYINNAEIYIFERANRIIGIYVLQKQDHNAIEIKNIAVDIAHQGQGIGSFLIEDAVKKSKAKGFQRVLIGTGDASIKQLYIYQKAGFEIFEIKKNFFLDNYPEPIFENGIQLKHMIMLKKELD